MEQYSLPGELEVVFFKYEEMQHVHLKLLEDGQIPDMNKMTFERNMAFEELKNKLSETIRTINKEDYEDPAGMDVAMACKYRLSSIMKQDSLLSDCISKYKGDVQETLKNMKKGKKALHGYQGPGKDGSPKFVSQEG